MASATARDEPGNVVEVRPVLAAEGDHQVSLLEFHAHERVRHPAGGQQYAVIPPADSR